MRTMLKRISASLLAPIWNPFMPKLSTVRLTDTLIRSLKSKNQRYDVYDASQPGFGIRVATSGALSWVLLTRENGRRKRITLGGYPAMSLSKAREAARVALSEVQEGTFGRKKVSSTFETAVKDWYAREQRARKSFPQVEQAMRLHVLPYLGRHQIDQITKADLMRVIDRIADQGKLTQANRVRAFITRFFNWATERDLVTASPAAALPRPAVEVSRDRVLSRDELLAIWQAAEQMGFPFGRIAQLLILTAQRRDEVAGMRWSELDLERARWIISKERAKNSKAHIVHLSPQALALLSRIPRKDGTDFVFTTTGRSAVSGFSKAKSALDACSHVSDWRLHDLRRTAATFMADDLRIAPVVTDRILNHVSGTVRGVAAIYQRGEHLADREAALIAWGQLVEDLVNSNK
jgi:integrase